MSRFVLSFVFSSGPPEVWCLSTGSCSCGCDAPGLPSIGKLGISSSSGLLAGLDWRGVTVGVALVFVIRPLAAWGSLQVAARRDPLPGGLDQRGRLAVAFFGIRGVGSIYYLAWASLEADFSEIGWLWSTVGFTIALSVVVHGMAAAPVMKRLERDRPEREPQPA